MKRCLECNTQMNDDVFVCPNCGAKGSIGSYSGDEALAALDALSTANKAERIVDEGAALYMAGDQQGAIRKLHEALGVNPRSAMANFNMGYILLQQGKPADAVPWLEKALAIDPNIEGGPGALAEARSASQKKSGCFIATVAYGSPDASSVVELKRFRDERLLSSRPGRQFVRAYYAISPHVVPWLMRHPRVTELMRIYFLDRVVTLIRKRADAKC